MAATCPDAVTPDFSAISRRAAHSLSVSVTDLDTDSPPDERLGRPAPVLLPPLAMANPLLFKQEYGSFTVCQTALPKN